MPATVDGLIRGAELYDGNGSPAELADVAIEAERIAEIGSLGSISGRLEIDARGFAFAPVSSTFISTMILQRSRIGTWALSRAVASPRQSLAIAAPVPCHLQPS